MSGFLDRLAGLATGSPVPGAARVALPSRFAPVSSAPLPNADAATTDDVSAAPKSPAGEARPVRVAQKAAQEFVPLRPLEESRKSLSEIATIAERTDASRSRPESRPASVVPPQHARVTPKIDVSPKLSPPRAHAAQESRAPIFVSPMPEDRTLTDMPLRATVIAAREPVPANRAPLNADILAARPQTAHNAPPPIHVTIDRIDVRVAPAAKTAPPPPRVRRGPSQSLAEYLRGPERGGRT